MSLSLDALERLCDDGAAQDPKDDPLLRGQCLQLAAYALLTKWHPASRKIAHEIAERFLGIAGRGLGVTILITPADENL